MISASTGRANLGGTHPQPQPHGGLDLGKLSGRERAETPDEPDQRHRHDPLRIKGLPSGSERSTPLRSASPDAGCVRNQGDKRSIRVRGRNTENERGANLCGQPKVDEPDLPARGRLHDDFSAFSNSRNTSSAAKRRSSSLGAVYSASMGRRSRLTNTSC